MSPVKQRHHTGNGNQCSQHEPVGNISDLNHSVFSLVCSFFFLMIWHKSKRETSWEEEGDEWEGPRQERMMRSNMVKAHNMEVWSPPQFCAMNVCKRTKQKQLQTQATGSLRGQATGMTKTAPSCKRPERTRDDDPENPTKSCKSRASNLCFHFKNTHETS